MHTDSIRRADHWQLQKAVTPKALAVMLVAVLFLAWTGKNSQMDKAAAETAGAVGHLAGLGESKVISGAANFLDKAFPLVFAQRTETVRLDDFDPNDLPPFAHVETVVEREYDALTDSFEEITSEYLVQPFGYLLKVLGKMWETVEMAVWGTLLSIMISIPLGILSAKNYTPHIGIYYLARGWLGFHRAMPELILALFFVLMYGFGPVAGILALAMHTSGVLGKFMADDIENADPGPQQALRTSGANRLKVLRFAVLPQVLPQYYAYVQYILERNIRTATVLGIVGAGGIGTELKGRWDVFDYGHVATILLVIFATVMLLEVLTQRLRRKVM